MSKFKKDWNSAFGTLTFSSFCLFIHVQIQEGLKQLRLFRICLYNNSFYPCPNSRRIETKKELLKKFSMCTFYPCPNSRRIETWFVLLPYLVGLFFLSMSKFKKDWNAQMQPAKRFMPLLFIHVQIQEGLKLFGVNTLNRNVTYFSPCPNSRRIETFVLTTPIKEMNKFFPMSKFKKDWNFACAIKNA